jgi:hypothetical protein
MCDWTLALSIASAGMQYIGGQQAAANQAEAIAQQTAIMQQQANEKEKQINEQAANTEAERNKQGMIERAQMKTTAGESGALGFTSDRLLKDSFMQQGTDLMSIEANRTNQIKQTENEKLGLVAKGNTASAEAYAKAPSLLGTGLQIAGDVVSYKTKVGKYSTAKTTG